MTPVIWTRYIDISATPVIRYNSSNSWPGVVLCICDSSRHGWGIQAIKNKNKAPISMNGFSTLCLDDNKALICPLLRRLSFITFTHFSEWFQYFMSLWQQSPHLSLIVMPFFNHFKSTISLNGFRHSIPVRVQSPHVSPTDTKPFLLMPSGTLCL